MKIKNKLQLKYLTIKTDEYEVDRDYDDDEDIDYEKKTMATYKDPVNNIEIILNIDDDEDIYLFILNGQDDKNKPPAPKGLTRNILCNILKHLVDKNLIKMSSNMTLSPGDLGGQTGRAHDQDKLENMYKNMGFTQGEDRWSQSVKGFLKWCHSKYPDSDKEHSCPHPMPQPEPEPIAEPINEFDEDQDTYEDETDDEQDYDLDFTDDEYATEDEDYDQETDDDLTEEDYDRMQAPEPAKQMEMAPPLQQKEILKPVPRIKTYEDYFHNS